jgi:hypothetical protein
MTSHESIKFLVRVYALSKQTVGVPTFVLPTLITVPTSYGYILLLFLEDDHFPFSKRRLCEMVLSNPTPPPHQPEPEFVNV